MHAWATSKAGQLCQELSDTVNDFFLGYTLGDGDRDSLITPWRVRRDVFSLSTSAVARCCAGALQALSKICEKFYLRQDNNLRLAGMPVDDGQPRVNCNNVASTPPETETDAHRPPLRRNLLPSERLLDNAGTAWNVSRRFFTSSDACERATGRGFGHEPPAGSSGLLTPPHSSLQTALTFDMRVVRDPPPPARPVTVHTRVASRLFPHHFLFRGRRLPGGTWLRNLGGTAHLTPGGSTVEPDGNLTRLYHSRWKRRASGFLPCQDHRRIPRRLLASLSKLVSVSRLDRTRQQWWPQITRRAAALEAQRVPFRAFILCTTAQLPANWCTPMARHRQLRCQRCLWHLGHLNQCAARPSLYRRALRSRCWWGHQLR
jgi:hypothetical protein